MSNYPHWTVFPPLGVQCEAMIRPPSGKPHRCSRVAAPATNLCELHHGSFRELLAQLVLLYPDLEQAAYVKARRRDSSGVRSSGVIDVGASWNPHAKAVRVDVDDWADYLVRVTLDVYPLRTGESHGLTESTKPAVKLATIGRWFPRWWSAYPEVGPSVFGDAQQLLTRVHQALHTDSIQVAQLEHGSCPEVTGEIDLGAGTTNLICGAPLLAAIRRADDVQGASEIYCSANPNHKRRTPDQWMELAYAVRPA